MRDAMLEALPGVRRFARSLTNTPHDADDLLQATVERVLSRPVPHEVHIERWMFRICKNLWIDELRARDVRRNGARQLERSAEPTVSGEDVAVSELTLREVDRAMSALPPEQRAVLGLVALQGMAYREAAEVLEIPVGTVMSRLARARAALAAQLESTPATEA